LVKGNFQPEADRAVARAFRAEVIKFNAVLIAEGLDVRSVNEAVHRMCPAEGEGNEETKEAQGDGAVSAPVKLFGRDTCTQTHRMLKTVFALTKHNRPLQVIGEFYQALENYGDFIGDDFPGTHCATKSKSNQRNQASDAIRVISYTLHNQVNERMRAAENIIIDDVRGVRVALRNPCKINFDSYSRGTRSLFCTVVRIFQTLETRRR
jgi:hypothetical protein